MILNFSNDNQESQNLFHSLRYEWSVHCSVYTLLLDIMDPSYITVNINLLCDDQELFICAHSIFSHIS